LPALHAGALHPPGDTPQALARPLIVKTLVEVARIERATAVAHGAAADAGIETLIRALASDLEVIGAPQATANPVSPALSKPAAARVDNGADVEITFDRDVPVAINGVPMSLTELIESLTVIALQHGVPASANFVGAPAIAVLQAAFDARRREEITTAVRIRLQHGITTAAPVSSTELAATALLAARRS
jgi:argininosuccinate synthase